MEKCRRQPTPIAHCSETDDAHSIISISEYTCFTYSVPTEMRLLYYTAVRWTKINLSLAIHFSILNIILCLTFPLAPTINPLISDPKPGGSQLQAILKVTSNFRVSISLGLKESWC